MSDEPKPLNPGVFIALAMAFVGALVLGYVMAPLLSSNAESDGFSAFAGALVFMLVVAAVAYGVKRKY